MTNESPKDGCGDESNPDSFAQPTRRTYLTLVGGCLAFSGGSATAAGSGTVEGKVAKSIDSADGSGYGVDGYGAGSYGGDGSEEEPSLSDYTDVDGNAEANNVFDAIKDWRNGKIDPNLVFNVIEAWRE